MPKVTVLTLIFILFLFTWGLLKVTITPVLAQSCTSISCNGPGPCLTSYCGDCVVTGPGPTWNCATSPLENVCCSNDGDCNDPAKPNCIAPQAGQQDCDLSLGYGKNLTKYCTAPTSSKPGFVIPNYREIGQSGFKFWQGNPTNVNAGQVVSALIPYLYVIAGLLLFVYLLYGGFQLVTSFGSPKAILEAWLIVFRALVGFIIVFVSFWLVRVVEKLFSLQIL